MLSHSHERIPALFHSDTRDTAFFTIAPASVYCFTHNHTSSIGFTLARIIVLFHSHTNSSIVSLTHARAFWYCFLGARISRIGLSFFYVFNRMGSTNIFSPIVSVHELCGPFYPRMLWAESQAHRATPDGGRHPPYPQK